jgi:hypothetical protein
MNDKLRELAHGWLNHSEALHTEGQPIHEWAAFNRCALELIAALESEAGGWRPIETAAKDQTTSIILGFAPDEEDFSPDSREGFWSADLGRWASSLDPMWLNSPQPTHWQPLPAPPEVPNVR